MPLYAIAAALLVACCWGGNFSASKFAMMDFPPFVTVMLRFIIVSLLLAPMALRQKNKPRLRDMGFIALTLIILHFGLIFCAMHMGLNLSSVIVATQMGVPFACVISAVMFQDYLGPWRSLGLMIAFLGVLVVALTPNASQHWGAFMMATMGALAWAAANIYLKRLGKVNTIAFLFWPGLLALPVLAVLSLLFESHQWTHIVEARWTSWAGILYSTISSSLIGYSLWNWLISRYPLSQVIPYSLCVPVAGIASGVVFFDEPLTAQILLGAALTIVGVGIIAMRRPKLAEMEQV